MELQTGRNRVRRSGIPISFLIFVTIAFFGCRTFDPALLRPTPGEVTPRLLRLSYDDPAEVAIAGANRLTVNSYMYTLFERELQNITEATGDEFGTVEVTVIFSDYTINYAWTVVSGMLLMVPNIFGMPIGSGTAQLEFEVEIFDRAGETVWKEDYYAKEKKYFNIYMSESYNASQEDDEAEQILLVFRQLLMELKQDLDREAEQINQKLLQ